MDLTALNSLLFSCHAMLAAMTKTPELVLSEAEATSLANATANVAKHYDIAASEKTLAWGNFAIVAGAVYGPRIVMASRRKKEERAARGAQAAPARPAFVA